MGIINRLILFFWHTQKKHDNNVMASSEFGQLRMSIDNLQRQVNRVERQVYRRLAKGNGEFQEETEFDWLKGEKNA